jgi:hypothetical protein
MTILTEGFRGEHPFPELYTPIELEINLLKNHRRFDFCPNREDYLNWIPFEFRFQIGDNESYIYPKEFGATFSLEELKRWIENLDELFIKIAKREQLASEDYIKDRGRVEFYALETYFNLEFSDETGGAIGTTLWIEMGLIPVPGEEGGIKRGFRFTTALKDLKKFVAELKTQLDTIIAEWNIRN